MDSTIFYIFLFIHLISLVTGFGAVLVIDAFGLAWLTKSYKVDLALTRRVAQITQKIIWIGYTGMIVSGIPLLAIKGEVDNLTQIKIFLVGLIGLNGIFLHTIKLSLDELGDKVTKVPKKIMFRVGLATGISQFGWWGAMMIGFYHRHIEHFLTWPKHEFLIMGLILLVVGIVAVVGERLTSKG